VAKDWADHLVERWLPVLPDLDPDVEGVVVRMKRISEHLRKARAQSLVDFGLQRHEFDTMHALAGRRGTAAPSELADDLDIAPASVTGRIDGLVGRGYVERVTSTVDRRRVDIWLTEDGWSIWRGAMEALGGEESRLMAKLTPEQRSTLADLLRTIALAAEQST